MAISLGDHRELLALIAQRAAGLERPLIVAVDGRSGVGKSTLAQKLAGALEAALIEGDDFYAGGLELRDDSPASRAAACIDWTRQSSVLEALRNRREAVWRAFDWESFDGRLVDSATRLRPEPIVILEGVYSARPELAQLMDVSILLRIPEADRIKRLVAREGIIGPWERQWHEAEEYYFHEVMPAHAFAIIVEP